MGVLADILDGEAVVLHHDRPGGRCPEGIHADHGDLRTDIGSPAEGHAGLDGQEGHARGQDLVPIVFRLHREKVGAGQAHHPGLDALGSQPITALQRQMHFGTGRDQNDVGLGTLRRVRENIATQRHSRGVRPDSAPGRARGVPGV